MSLTATIPATSNIAYQILLDSLGAMRNGFVYGCKIRAPHTFVLQMVWSKGTWKSVWDRVLDLTTQHATNLALNAVFFKIGVALLKLAQGSTQPWHHALVGGICGFYFWGKNNAVNVQVNMYMMSRALSGLLLLFLEKRKLASGTVPLTSTEKYLSGAGGYRLLAAAIWGAALYIFFHHAHVLHGSLRQSMDFIYRQGDEHEGSIERLIKGKPDEVPVADKKKAQ
jgi:peroxisomal membrane protein 4